MSLLDEIKQAQVKNTCGVHAVLQLLKDKDRLDLQQAIEDPNIFSSTIGAVLAKRSLPKLSGHVIGKHRRRECSCWRTV